MTLKKGDVITIDGGSGHLYEGAVPTVSAALSGEFGELMGWADAARTMKVRANADTPLDARTARAFGAEGIGLCRTEHMFFDEERIQAMREMILADDARGRAAALAKLLPFQREDFVGHLPRDARAAGDHPPARPAAARVPADRAEAARASSRSPMGVPVEKLAQRTKDLHEFNPMLGHRGCRLAITSPRSTRCRCAPSSRRPCRSAAEGIEVHPEIMIPLAITRAELERTRAIVDDVAKRGARRRGKTVPFRFGTMIELPRAAMLAGELRGRPSSSRSARTTSRRRRWACRATTRASSCRRTSRRASCRRTRSCRSTRRAWARS